MFSDNDFISKKVKIKKKSFLFGIMINYNFYYKLMFSFHLTLLIFCSSNALRANLLGIIFCLPLF